MLHGWIDGIDGNISGWAYDHSAPHSPVRIEIYINGAHYGNVTADQPRPDLASLNIGNTNYGFSIKAPRGLKSDAVVFGKSGDSFIIQTPRSREKPLSKYLHHQSLVDDVAAGLELVLRGPSLAEDQSILDRICQMASRNEGSASFDLGPIWGALKSSRHGDVEKFVKERDLPALGSYLAELGKQPLAVGFLGGPEAHAANLTRIQYRRDQARTIFDRIVSLAEAIGVIHVENPEQGPWGEIVGLSPDFVLDAIAAAYGIQNFEASVGGIWGLQTSHGIVNTRSVTAIYAAARIKALCGLFGLHGVVEIGGGAGLVAHYSMLMGCDRYKITDLPTVGITQAYTLRNHPGLALYGEPTDEARIEIMPPAEFARAPKGRFELLFNMDSLPEIEPETAAGYLRSARELGFRYFLSVNQESGNMVDGWRQGKVRNIAEKAGGYELMSRHRDWMRPGYVEELYRIIPA
ncbi:MULTISPECIES: hypothetical protein [unclassified Rhizobium]|uniref:hypothetical protein n=1 Tax=unclassified Rhizobium TaxID=2613769 RepID=UPI00162185E9|nr:MULTISPECIES: hypothetical protein [unclassified Rhizobium]MBB3286313.1 hypothetical protein [Rhizobium sp. BK252]MBB3401493.1 hypothetical protein [Rhizobium sp. BK289]MBB3414071.1 hypothetical protein [Rhizobium sp. BK284]MBB3481958.1 hypothetical protein [Rhizobium sp. BK347]